MIEERILEDFISKIETAQEYYEPRIPSQEEIDQARLALKALAEDAWKYRDLNDEYQSET